MDAVQFFDWLEGQEQRHELVDGVPVAMAGAKRRHDRIVVNTIAVLHAQLRGAKCQEFSADTAVMIPGGNIRYPDAGVDCGSFNDEARWADAPAIVIEVLSPSTRFFDLFRKFEEYKTVPSLRHVVILNPDDPQAIHWSRGGNEVWSYHDVSGLDQRLVFEEPSLALQFADLFEGLEFQPRPRLVIP